MTIEKSDRTRSILPAYNAPPSVQVPCKPWSGSIDRLGYGRVSGSVRYAHIVAYESHHGPIADGLEVDHLCNNRSCVEPSHLEAVTHAENMRRRHERAGFTRRSQVPRSRVDGECSRGHALVESNVYVVPRTGRTRCRQCNRDRMAEHVERVAVANENRKAAANTDVRSTLDHLAEAVCAEIRSKGRRGRLAIKAVQR